MEPLRQPLQPLDTREKAVDAIFSALTELAAALKLIFGVSTGAVVLFVNLLVGGRFPRAVSCILVASILCFAFAAIRCLNFHFSLVQVRIIMAQGLIDQKPDFPGRFQSEMAKWQQITVKIGKLLNLSFTLGFLFAAAFALAFLFVRWR